MKANERLEQIYTEYIGNGQFGIDFEKKHIIEAIKFYAIEACIEQRSICLNHAEIEISDDGDFDIKESSIFYAPLPEGLE